MRAIINLALLISFMALVAVVHGSYWDMPWQAVHDRPVFRTRPEAKWTFSVPGQQSNALGKIVINDETGDILLALGRTDAPLFHVVDKYGVDKFSWNATSAGAISSGTITMRNDVVYAYSDESCELFAVAVPSGELLWNVTDLCPEGAVTSATPITWLKNDTVMLMVLGFRIVTVKATDGTVLMNFGPMAVPCTLLPPVSSRVDDHFLFHAGNDTVFKLNVETGQVVWSLTLGTNPVETSLPAPPAVDDDGSIYVPTYTGIVYKLSANGAPVWSTQPTLQLAATQSAPVLVNSTHILVTSGYSTLRFFVVRKSDGSLTQIYADDDSQFRTTAVRSQLYWNNNVLYAVTAQAEVAAWDTTDLTQLKLLWIQSATSTLSAVYGGGPSIAKDGTIIVASGYGYNAVGSLMAFGCPVGQRVGPDGSTCLCALGSELLDDKCVVCAANKISNDATNVTCQVCQAGSVPNAAQSDCSLCADDTFSNEGDATCKPCSEAPDNEQCVVPVAPTAPVAAPGAKSPTSNITNGASMAVTSFALLLVAIAL